MSRSVRISAMLLWAAMSAGCATSAAPEAVVPDPVVATAAVAVEPAVVEVPTPPAPTTYVRLDEHRTLADAIEVGRLTVWPVLTDAPDDSGGFVALTDAQKRRKAEVRERAPDGTGLSLAQRIRERLADQAVAASPGRTGSNVSSVVVDNGGTSPLFVAAGTLVRGGNQDRVFAMDLVVPPDAAVLAPVHCIERGRSTAVRNGRATGGRFEAVECLALAEIRAASQHEGSQETVWNRVARANDVRARSISSFGDDYGSRTGSLFVSIDGARESVRHERKRVADVVLREIDALESRGVRPVGLAYAVNGRPVAVRAYAGAQLFRAELKAILAAIAMEVETAKAVDPPPRARAEDVATLVREIGAGRFEPLEDHGSFRIARRRTGFGWSSACRVTVDGREMTLTEDWTAR